MRSMRTMKAENTKIPIGENCHSEKHFGITKFICQNCLQEDISQNIETEQLHNIFHIPFSFAEAKRFFFYVCHIISNFITLSKSHKDILSNI